MKAMILAAGRGERLTPLTDTIPKPLLKIGGERLIERHIKSLAEHGFKEIVVNVHHLAELIQDILGDGSRFGVSIKYSDESDCLRETGGGIAHALKLLGQDPFLAVNSDIVCDYPLKAHQLDKGTTMHLVMVDNPEHNPAGDFHLQNNRLTTQSGPKYTFAGIGYYHPVLFENRPNVFRLADVISEQIQRGRVSAEYFPGNWIDIGSPSRLHHATKLFA